MFEIEITIQKYLPRLLQARSLTSLITLLLLAVVLVIISRKTEFKTKTLAYGALAIAASFVLSYFRILKFPNGGSITLASMLPLFVFAYIAGTRAGMIAGICYGMLQFIQEPFYVHWAQFLLDYPLAFALLGTAGIFRDKLYMGAILGSTGRLICHFLSGVVFFGEYANGQNVYLYSLVYNISYIMPDALICLVILLLPNVKSAIKHVREFSMKSAY